MSNTVEYGIRINIDGNQAATGAVAGIRAEFDQLGAAVGRASESLQASRTAHTSATSQMEAEQAAIAQVRTETNELTSATDRSAAAVQASAGIQAGANSQMRVNQSVVAQIRNETRQYGTTVQATSQAVQASQNAQASATEQLRNRQAGLNDVMRPYQSQLEGTTARQRALRDEVSATARPVQQLGVSAAQTAAAMRQVPAQFTDIVTQLQGGQSPMTVLLQQGGQLRDMFGGAGAAARALGGYVLSLVSPVTILAGAVALAALAWHQGDAEQRSYAQTLIMTGNRIGTTSAQMADMAANISKIVGTQGAASDALNDIASGGRVAGENLEYFTRVAVQMERTAGKSTKETAADLAELSREPLKASEKLNERYNYLTAAVYAHIKSLKDQGEEDKAAAAAQTAYMEAFDKRSAELSTKLGFLERKWQGVKDMAKGAWDAILNVGREETPAQELGRTRNIIALKQQGLDQRVRNGEGDSRIANQLREELAVLRQVEASLQARVDGEKRSGEAAAAAAAKEEARLNWMRESDKYLTRQQQYDRDEAAIRKMGKEAGLDEATIQKRVDLLKRQYSDLNNVAAAGLEAQRNLEKEQYNRSLSDLESRHKRQLVSDVDFVKQKRDLQLQDLTAEEANVRKQADLASGKADLSERTKYLGQLRVLQERRKTIIQEANNALDEYARAATKAIGDQMRTWENATTTERAALGDEITLFGQSAEARKIAAEQLKIDAELRALIASWQKQGHTFTEQEIADLKKAAAARKDNIAAIMGERQALAGADQLRQENQKFAANSIVDEQARAAALLEIDANVWRERIKLAGDGTEAQKRLQEQFDQWYANRQMAPTLDRWKGIINNLDNDFREGFRNMLEHGHDAWSAFSKSIGNTLKASLADALYQTFIKKYVVQIVTSLAGAISGPDVAAALNGGSAPAASGASSPVSAAMAASNVYKLVTGGFDKIGSAVTSGVDKVMSQFGPGTIGSTGPSAAASMAGTVASYGAGLLAGHSIGNAIAGDYSVNHGQAVTNIASVVGAVIGGPIGGAIGGAIGGVINRAFGMGSKEVAAAGMRGTISGTGLTGSDYTSYHQDGGWFRSDKNWTETQAFSKEIVQQFTQGFSAIKAASTSFAVSIGLSGDAIKDYSRDFDIALTKDKVANEKAITDFFTTIGDEMANRLVPNLVDFSKAGESAATTLQRLAQDFQVTDQVAQLLGTSAVAMFGSVGLESAAARERLIDLAGGVDVLSQQAQFYAQNFLTEAQRLAPVKEAVDAAMASLGLADVKSREAFKNVVDGLDKTTQAGAEQFIALMKLEEAFAQVYPAIQDTTEALSEQADVLSRMRDAASGLLGGVDAAFSVLQKVVEREKTARQTAHDVEIKAIQAQIDAATAAQTKVKALSDSLRSALDSMRAPAGQDATDRAAAQAQIRTAIAIARAGGPLPTADSLKQALSTVAQSAEDQFATYADYLRDFYETQNDITALAGLSDDSLSVAEKTLATLNDQKAASDRAYEAEIRRLDDIIDNAESQIDILKGQSTTLLSIDDAIRGLSVAIQAASSNPVVSSAAAINNAYQTYLGRAPDSAGFEWWQNAAANGTPISQVVDGIANSTEADLNRLYQSVLGRAPDAEGLAFWMAAYGPTMDESEKADFVQNAQNSAEYKKLHGVPGFASGGDHLGGWRIVGENGPELEATGPARIFNAADTAAILGGGKSDADQALLTEVQLLREENKKMHETLDAGLFAIAKAVATTADIQDMWNTVGMPGLRKEEVASS